MLAHSIASTIHQSRESLQDFGSLVLQPLLIELVTRASRRCKPSSLRSWTGYDVCWSNQDWCVAAWSCVL